MWMKAGMEPLRSSSVQLDGGFGCAERCPFEQREAQVDGRGIERIDGVVEVESEILAAIKLPGSPDERLRDFGPDAPIAVLVGIGQSRAPHRLAEAHRIKSRTVRPKACLDVPQVFAPGQLREGHGPELLGAGKTPDPRVAAVSRHDSPEARPWHEIHQLREHRLPGIHGAAPWGPTPAKHPKFRSRRSNRHQGILIENACSRMAYKLDCYAQPDTSDPRFSFMFNPAPGL